MQNVTTTTARLIVLATCFVAFEAAASSPSRGLRFDSPGVLDISARDLNVPGGQEISVVVLAAADAARIASASAIDEQVATLPSPDEIFGCKTPSSACSTAGERNAIAASGGTVKREKNALSIAPTRGAAATFVDWKMAENKNADGDGERHWYLGALKGSGYHRVDVEFEHDAPGAFLTNPANGKSIFVHYASDVAALAPDGAMLLTYDPLNEPLSIRIVALDAAGPTVAMLCSGTASDSVHVEFKGWRDASTVELAVVAHGPRNRLAHAAPLRFSKLASGWQLAADDAAALAALSFSCRQFP